MKAGIYIHIPYCIKKCRYCDFVSFEKAPEDAYFSMLLEEMNSVRTDSADTVFFGGGTPSLASREQLGMLLDAVRKIFGLADGAAQTDGGRDAAEITIEVNPETVTAEKAAELKRLGFNRVSMGVQSLDDGVLKALGRVHSADRARQAFKDLREAGFDNINLDLIFGTPRILEDGTSGVQTFEVWQRTLEEVLEMRPEHVSFYSLQLEEGTRLYKDYTDGLVDLPPWEENRRMYHYAAQRLADSGYHHYEVSNAALPGLECRHNIKYWTMQPYLGFGVSAHSFIPAFGEDGRLEYAYRGEADWSGKRAGGAGSGDRRSAGSGGPGGLEKEAPEDLKGDFVFTQLRLTEGLDTGLYKRLFGTEFAGDFAESLNKLAEEDFLETKGGRVRLTQKGLDSTNPVMEKLLECL